MVKIIIYPNYTCAFYIECDIHSTINSIKTKIQEKLFIDENMYHLTFLNQNIKDNNITLNELNVKELDTINLYHINPKLNDDAINDFSQIDEFQYDSIMMGLQYSLDTKFELTKCGIKNMTKLCKQTSGILYSYLYLFSSEQIETLYKLEPNNYWFFRYLPSVELINKYWSKDSNKFHGITKNVVISVNERSQLIKTFLI